MKIQSRTFKGLARIAGGIAKNVKAVASATESRNLPMEAKSSKLEESVQIVNNQCTEIREELQILKQKLGMLVEISELNTILIEHRQEIGQLKRKIKTWEQTAIDFYRSMELTLSHSSVNEEYRKATERILSNFDRCTASMGMIRISPSLGDAFLDTSHKPTSSVDSDQLSPFQKQKIIASCADLNSNEFVLKCTRWGYRVGDEVVESAEVVVTTLPNSPISTIFSKWQADLDETEKNIGSSGETTTNINVSDADETNQPSGEVDKKVNLHGSSEGVTATDADETNQPSGEVDKKINLHGLSEDVTATDADETNQPSGEVDKKINLHGSSEDVTATDADETNQPSGEVDKKINLHGSSEDVTATDADETNQPSGEVDKTC